jgi:hypothetical protein
MAKINTVQANTNSKFFYFTVEGFRGRVTVQDDLKDDLFGYKLSSLVGQELKDSNDGISTVEGNLVITDVAQFVKAYSLDKLEPSILSLRK